MSEHEWVDGPPPEEDGLYAVLRKNGDSGIIEWIGDGWKDYRERFTRSVVKQLTAHHLRLPPIPEPPKPPRRCKAMINGEQVFGASSNGKTYNLVYWRPNGELRVRGIKDMLTGEVEWIDDEQGNQLKP